ncbi:YMGG-like glycine zipper-containing protein [Chitinophaga sp. OAE865]|uniref:YMGG-like glycine zipper-containing protein n=1 Tax=Chitinophaga sp. OAE865 TaxID=2817898 RepID=UPI001AE29FF5
MKQILVALAAAVVLFSCKSNADNAAAIESAKKATIDSMNNVNAIKQQVVDSMNALKSNRSHSRENVAGTQYNNEAAPVVANTEAPAPAPVKKKGWKSWSHTAKGAVVGAGAGAVTGAIVNKDRLKGAAIGTLIGAGVGAGTGAIVDHKKKQSAQ